MPNDDAAIDEIKVLEKALSGHDRGRYRRARRTLFDIVSIRSNFATWKKLTGERDAV